MPPRAGRIVVTPGPVHIPARRWKDIHPLHHRTDEFRLIARETEAWLREGLGTASPAYLLAASGTGAMEAAIANVARPRSRVLVVSGGKFGDRWAEIAEAYECAVDLLRFEDGAAIDIDAVAARAARERPEIVALTHVESSTGLLLDPREVIAILPEPRPMVLVDAVSSFGAEALAMDEWGIDCVVGAAQKGIAAPPGLSFVALGPRALERVERGRRGLYYFDLSRYAEGASRGETPLTPAAPAIQMAHASLARIREIGWEAVRERHRAHAACLLKAASCMSLETFPGRPSSAVQALAAPEGVDASRIVGQLALEGFIAAGGQGGLAGKLVRTGFLGLLGSETVAALVRALGAAAGAEGLSVDPRGVREVLEAFPKFAELF